MEEQKEYVCELHKQTHKGTKRPEFQKQLYDLLLNASLRDAYKLYKTLKIGCDCLENYKAFDELQQKAVIKEIVEKV